MGLCLDVCAAMGKSDDVVIHQLIFINFCNYMDIMLELSSCPHNLQKGSNLCKVRNCGLGQSKTEGEEE